MCASVCVCILTITIMVFPRPIRYRGSNKIRNQKCDAARLVMQYYQILVRRCMYTLTSSLVSHFLLISLLSVKLWL